jgi:uncharacterized LabA/DUF88 family protein
LKKPNQYKLKVAILIDGGFFLKRYHYLNKLKPGYDQFDAIQVVNDLYKMVLDHLQENYLYRVFYYDCEPFTKKIHNPISKKQVDFGRTPIATFRSEIFQELRKRRKVALRLGSLKDKKQWNIFPKKVKDLLNNKITLADLTEDDISYELIQKGVDIKIGVDIASLAYKRLVDKIILISGDSDFVPAAKVARREGIDFVLDPMWSHIDDNLYEHIDGLKTVIPKPD